MVSASIKYILQNHTEILLRVCNICCFLFVLQVRGQSTPHCSSGLHHIHGWNRRVNRSQTSLPASLPSRPSPGPLSLLWALHSIPIPTAGPRTVGRSSSSHSHPVGPSAGSNSHTSHNTSFSRLRPTKQTVLHFVTNCSLGSGPVGCTVMNAM